MDPIEQAFNAIKKEVPSNDDICIYKTGYVDSFDLMQILLEIELITGVRLELVTLMNGDISLLRLRTLLNRS